MYAKDYTGAKTEFARINSTITNSSLGSGDIILTGTNLQSGTANSPNGYLRIKINGAYYKIALLDD